MNPLLILEPHSIVTLTGRMAFAPGAIPCLQHLWRQGFELVVLETQGFDLAAFLREQELPNQHLKPELTAFIPLLKDSKIDWKRSKLIGTSLESAELASHLGIECLSTHQLSWSDIRRRLGAVPRSAEVRRKTKETDITVQLNLDGCGKADIRTGVGFFDHMLEQIAKHGNLDLSVKCEGDLHIDEHHSVEDVGLALGEALRAALGNKRGIARYGFLLPMDESQCEMCLDFSGRPYFRFDGEFPRTQVGELSTEMAVHFFRSLSEKAECNLHIRVDGENAHHMVEACFKSLGRCIRQAAEKKAGTDIPSTKGVL